MPSVVRRPGGMPRACAIDTARLPTRPLPATAPTLLLGRLPAREVELFGTIGVGPPADHLDWAIIDLSSHHKLPTPRFNKHTSAGVFSKEPRVPSRMRPTRPPRSRPS